MVRKRATVQLSDLERSLLRHVGRYRFSYAPLMARLFSEGQSLASTLQKLEQLKLLQALQPKRTDYKHYYLTYAGASIAELPKGRAEVFRGEAAPESAFRILCFCCMGKRRRSLLELQHVNQLLGCDFARVNRAYCVDVDKPASLYRIQISNPETEDNDLLKRVREDFKAAYKHKGLQPYLDARRYVNVILITQDSHEEKLRLLLRTSGVSKLGRVEFHVSPSWEARQPFLKEQFSDG